MCGRRLVGLDDRGDKVDLTFADGTTTHADIVVGADGIHSTVRHALFGSMQLRFSGRVGYRATVPVEHLHGTTIDDNTKWWGSDRHLIAYYVTRARDELYVMGTVPEPDFALESWSATADVGQFRAAFDEFHPTVRRMLGAVGQAHKWALADRTPMGSWSVGNVVLLGDAAHPMLPHMGQGAAMALEDVAVLTRCVDESRRRLGDGLRSLPIGTSSAGVRDAGDLRWQQLRAQRQGDGRLALCLRRVARPAADERLPTVPALQPKSR